MSNELTGEYSVITKALIDNKGIKEQRNNN